MPDPAETDGMTAEVCHCEETRGEITLIQRTINVSEAKVQAQIALRRRPKKKKKAKKKGKEKRKRPRGVRAS